MPSGVGDRLEINSDKGTRITTDYTDYTDFLSLYSVQISLDYVSRWRCVSLGWRCVSSKRTGQCFGNHRRCGNTD